MKKPLFFWNELMATFWFVPIFIIVLAVSLAVGLMSLDHMIEIPEAKWTHFFLVSSADSARSILSTISGAMIGVAGTVFSVTLVALTLASNQFGPRLIKNFMYVRLNQVVLGSFVATYLYCLLVLNAIKDIDGYTFIPSISIVLAILATMANIILLIFFIHQIATSIQADKVVSDISDLIDSQMKLLFPHKMGDEVAQSVDEQQIIDRYPYQLPIHSNKTGYVQYIDSEHVLDLVVAEDALLRLNYRPGEFLVEGVQIATLYFHEKPSKDFQEKINSQLVLGKTKTSQQDLEFSIHQMVEIASRALSPGVNDPYTAITCIDNLTATLCHLAQAKFPSEYRVDDNEQLRIITSVMHFEGILDIAFNQIRQFAKGNTAVIMRMMHGLSILIGFVERDADRQAVIKHAQMVLRAAEQSIDEENDLRDLKKIAENVLA